MMRAVVLAGCLGLGMVMGIGPARAETPVVLADASLTSAARAALDHLDRNRFAEALNAASRRDLALVAKTVTWAWYRDPANPADFATLARFIEDSPGWPDLDDVRRNAERKLVGVPARTAFAFLERYPPLTAPGLIAYADGLEAAGRGAEVPALARAAWRDMPIPSEEAEAFLRRFGSTIRAEDHIARLERLLWDGQAGAAREQMARVPAGWRRLAEARLALQARSGNVNAAIAAVPAELRDNGGLMFDRARWRRRADLDDGALEVIRAKPADLGRPEEWWDEISIHARRILREGRPQEAYALARDHGQVSGFPLADAEFLAGFIALRFLNQPEAAFQHFKTLFLNVGYPVSLSRGAYWAGRAAEAAGQPDIARQWYQEASRHLHSFYGQTAWMKLPPAERPTPPIEPLIDPAGQSTFDRLELVRLIRLLHGLGETERATRFVRHMTTQITEPSTWPMLARLALEIDRPDLAVVVGREAWKSGVALSVSAFPSLALQPGPDAEPAVLLGLIRQESGFDLDARSRAGALGLMQLMPGTAKQVAGELSLPYRPDALTSDARYNVALGRAYLADLIADFDGSLVMALAGYNAGPSRVSRWVADHGDPRESFEKALDWVEMIPFYETRNYVQRVLENATVYRWRQMGPQAGLALNHTPALARTP